MANPDQKRTAIISLVGLIVVLVSAIAAVVVVPEVRSWIGVDKPATLSFSGKWATEPSVQDNFLLELTQDGRGISGYHTAVAYGGRKIDTRLPGDGPSINGVIKDDKGGAVTFVSSFEGQGKATLQLSDNKLYWAITEENGEHYLPKFSTLYKVAY